ncbi:hypothetical protein [Nitrosomonas aestuarii]|nr:hypothetical protein [Nitrosomonas aestuarii]
MSIIESAPLIARNDLQGLIRFGSFQSYQSREELTCALLSF